MSTDEARQLAAEHNLATQHRLTVEKDAALVHHLINEEGSIKEQMDHLWKFEEEVVRKKKVDDVRTKMDRARFNNVLTRRDCPNPIISVKCTKPKKDNILKVHITRRGPDHRDVTEVVFARELVKYGFSEWTQILDIIKGHKSMPAQELKLTLNLLIKKVQGLNLVPAPKSSAATSSSSATVPRKRSSHAEFLLSHDTVYIDNSLPAGVEVVQHRFIREPVHGIFYLDGSNHMCFQRTDELGKAPTEHLFHLRLECMAHEEADGFHWLISLELSKRLDELKIDNYKWIKPEIIDEAEKFSSSVLYPE